MGQSVTRMGALHCHKYPKAVFPIDEQQELSGYFQSQMPLEAMVTYIVLETLGVKLDWANVPSIRYQLRT